MIQPEARRSTTDASWPHRGKNAQPSRRVRSVTPRQIKGIRPFHRPGHEFAKALLQTDQPLNRESTVANEQESSKKSVRGFAAMNQEKQRLIASQGGKAAHEQGTAHRFSSEEAQAAGRKGGESVSQNRQHMAEIGRKGGEARQRNASLARQTDDIQAQGWSSKPSSPSDDLPHQEASELQRRNRSDQRAP